ncbi:MAG: hypothetical protein ACRDL7_09085 [Gaiellaceae bacterium]
MAVSEGGAAHLIDQYEYIRDGYAAWQNLLLWFDGDNMKLDTGIDLRQKQQRLRLLPGASAETYINGYRLLQNQLVYLGQSQPEGDVVINFLSQITDSEYLPVKEYCCMAGIIMLEDTIFQVRKKERALDQERQNN